LTGKYEPGHEFTQQDDHRAGIDAERMQRRLEQSQRIRKGEVPEGLDMAPWALAWCLQHSAVTCVIPGCKSVAQVEANAAAVESNLVSDGHPQALP
jgi:aryl-alcohol dehydrogenase-like predicted oxidoreductase